MVKTSSTVLCDLDGTLALIDHRLKYVKDLPSGQKKDWKSFFLPQNIMQDRLNKPVFAILQALYKDGHKIVFVSARPNKTKDVTKKWLEEVAFFIEKDSKVLCSPYMQYEKLYMRGDTFAGKDMREDSIVKKELLSLIKSEGYDPFIVLDDRQRVVDMWRDEGIFCAQVAKGDF